jgi:hypothetical protein
MRMRVFFPGGRELLSLLDLDLFPTADKRFDFAAIGNAS